MIGKIVESKVPVDGLEFGCFGRTAGALSLATSWIGGAPGDLKSSVFEQEGC